MAIFKIYPMDRKEIKNMNNLISPSAREVLQKSREQHYVFQVVGDYGTLKEPMFRDGWWYIPEDDPIISENAIQRVELVRAITPIKGFIVAHEAPKMLCPPKPQPKPQPKPAYAPRKVEIDLDWPSVWAGTKNGLKIVGGVLVGTLYVLAEVLSLLAQVDPKLIVVLEDGTWMEVMSWYE
jgi:hypothetical protein